MRKASVDCSHRALWRLGSCLFIFELDFIPSAKIEAAVGIIRAVYFEVNLKVGEFFVALQVGTMIFIEEIAVLNDPVAISCVADGSPTA